MIYDIYIFVTDYLRVLVQISKLSVYYLSDFSFFSRKMPSPLPAAMLLLQMDMIVSIA